jgi:hypothetical protein
MRHFVNGAPKMVRCSLVLVEALALNMVLCSVALGQEVLVPNMVRCSLAFVGEV